MDDPSVTDRIITEMKQYKMQGRTYAQVTALLKEVGYTDAQLAAAEEQFNYDAPVAYDRFGNPIDTAPKLHKLPKPAPALPTPKPVPAPAPVKAAPKAVKQKLPRPYRKLNLRPVTYVVVAAATGFLSAQVYRLWLHLQYLSSVYNPKYLLSHNMIFYYLWGGVGVAVGVTALKYYFRWLDQQ